MKIMVDDTKKRKAEAEDPVDTLGQERYWEASKAAREIPKTTTTTLMNYPGWDALLKDLEVKTPEGLLRDKTAELDLTWTAITAAHSPLTPEAAYKDATTFETRANTAHISLVALLTAIEAAGCGQLETPALLAMAAPALGAMLESAKEVRKAYFEASFIRGLRYFVNARFQPTVIPADVLTSAYAMGIIDKILYNGLMLYHGFTVERSDLMARTESRMPDSGTILELTRRGTLTTTGAADWLVLGKMPRATADAVLSLTNPLLATTEILDLMASEFAAPAVASEYLTKRGYGIREVGLLTRLGYRYPALSEILELLRRGIITSEKATDLLVRGKLPRAEASTLLSLKDVVPPLPDLVTMAVREAFPVEPGPPQYAELTKYGAMHGLSAWWTERYRYMSMIPMDLRQAYENLWRGHFDKTAFYRYLRIADIHERDWDAIYRVAFTPPTVRELGYGYDVGVYTESDIATYRRWGGLSLEDSSKAAKAMVEYRTAAEKEAVRREHLALFARKRITETAFRTALTDLKTPSASLELWVKRGLLQQTRLFTPETAPIPNRGEMALMAEWGIITEADLANLLISDGLDPAWAPKVARARILSQLRDEYGRIRTTLTDRFREGFITESVLRTKLVKLSFSAESINASVDAANEASTWDDLKEQAAEWWRLAKAGRITPEKYATEVRALGMTETRITRKLALLGKLAAIPKA